MPKMNWNIYTVPSSFLSIRVAIALMLTEFLAGIGGYMAIEGYGLIDAFYMTVITISTVGFSEVQPLNPLGRLFTSSLIIVNIGIFAYVLAAFSYYVIQGEIFKNMHLNHINSSIDKLQDHIILCGYGKYGREIAMHFNKHKLQFVVLDVDPTKIEQLQKSVEKTLYLEDDATHDEALLKAGIKRAHALTLHLPDENRRGRGQSFSS